MEHQRQCPNCEGYRVIDNAISISKETGQKAVVVNGGYFFGILGLLILIGTEIGVPIFIIYALTSSNLINELQNQRFGDAPAAPAIFALVWWLWITSLLGIYFYRKSTGRVQTSKIVTQHRYSCLLCGFEWQWREDQLYTIPYVSPTRDPAKLRQLGEQRLREEAAKEQRLADERAYWANQQRQNHGN